MTATRFRQRKLSTKASLQVIDDSQIDVTDDDTRHIATIESGVERTEEIEHHLQAAISAASTGSKSKDAVIPTPDASKTIANYDTLYRKNYSHPQSYIRFSSTVEDTSDPLYCIDEEDDEYLTTTNTARKAQPNLPIISELKFEEAISEFETLTAIKQPFLGLNEDENLPIHLMTFDEMSEAAFETDSGLSENPFAKDLFPYWEARRKKRKGMPLMPILKFEQGQTDKDDGDPYVCFRRREHRPARKTRRTDAQSIDKLKRLRLDMERVRSLSKCVLIREDAKKENQILDAKVYLTRCRLKKYKRDFNIVDNDDDLVNKPRKRQVEQPPPPPKAPVRTEGKPPEADLVQLDDLHKLRQETLQQAIQKARKSRQYSSAGWLDKTTEILQKQPLTPPPEKPKSFRQVRTYYARQLLSPPPSASPSLSPSSPNSRASGILQPRITFQTSSHTATKRKRDEDDESEAPRFRIRTGRNGRLMMDRRGMTLNIKDLEAVDDRLRDRFKFDHDDSDDESETYRVANTYNRDNGLLFSANLFLQQVMPQRRQENLANAISSPATGLPTPNTPATALVPSPLERA